MKVFALIAIVSLLLLVGCTKPSAGTQPGTAPAPALQKPLAAAPTPAPAEQLSDADVQQVDDSLSEMDALLKGLDANDLGDSGITPDTFK